MNIVEALKSKKGIKRKHEPCFTHFEPSRNPLLISYEDLIADDWEIEEDKITISRTELYQSIADLLKEDGVSFWGPRGVEDISIAILNKKDGIKRLAKKLGFDG